MNFKAEIPIIIINWNGLEDTIECMNSVFNLTYQNYKVYLVDNNSTDGSQSILLEKFGRHPKVKLLLNKENFGFTKANNKVFTNILSQSNIPPYVALLNNDTVVTKDWLLNLYLTAEHTGAAIVASKMIDYFDHGKMDNAGHLMLNTGEILPIGHGQDPKSYGQSFENMGACAGACLYSTEMLKVIGLFDEYFDTGYEDAELGVRAIMAGYTSIFEPKAIVYHKMGSSIKKVFNYDYALSIQKNVLYTYLKLMPSFNLIINFPFLLLRYILILFVQLLSFRRKQAKLIFQAIREIIFLDGFIIKTKRRHFQQVVQIDNYEISKRQTFFLKNNLIRFYKYFLMGKASALEVYGKRKPSKIIQ